jgi:uncharacterized protein YegP (UPF0339 family)
METSSVKRAVFEKFQSKKDGQWRYRLIAANGEPVGGVSEPYDSESNCERGCTALVNAAISAKNLNTGNIGFSVNTKIVEDE